MATDDHDDRFHSEDYLPPTCSQLVSDKMQFDPLAQLHNTTNGTSGGANRKTDACQVARCCPRVSIYEGPLAYEKRLSDTPTNRDPFVLGP